ncbi:SDR family oxidoreductase [Streptomyces rubiginosohelvolus]|uniref:SDR family oxidoreductase n=1 Tax=Streptomyces rubiginosohelvolus TaxID=67362 RepID=A0ABW6EX14_9ACTN
MNPTATRDRASPGPPPTEVATRDEPDPGDGRYRQTRQGGDLLTGDGLDEAVTATSTVIHCATSNDRTDVTATRNLTEAALRAGRPHLIYVSIVGVDRVSLPYYRAKLESERLVEDSGLPWTVQRTTQFHDLVAWMSSVQRWLPATLLPSGDSRRRLPRLPAGGPPRSRARRRPDHLRAVPDGHGPVPGTARMSARSQLRAGLVFLTAAQFIVGGWALLSPRSFFDIPWVGMRMPYNAHLMMDYGAMSLATSVVLCVGAVTLRQTMIHTGLAVYLVFALPHLVIHLRLLHHLTPGQRVPLLTALTAAVVIPLVLLALTRRARQES